MKNKYIFTFLVLLATGFYSKATVRTVSNNLNSPGQFTTVTAAITAASNGDTIYVHASPLTYADFTVNKQLTFIGIGHNPQNQVSHLTKLNNVYLATGSSGSRFIGFYFYYLVAVNSTISNIQVLRNYFTWGIDFNNQNTFDNWLIEGNVFAQAGVNIYLRNQASSYMTIRNNIFNGYIQEFNTNSHHIAILNNIFLYNGNFVNSTFGPVFTTIENNIFYRSSPQGATAGVNDCFFNKNISYQCSNNNFPIGTNYTNVDPQFVSVPGVGNFSYANNYALQNASVGHNGGSDATDVGVYGGLGLFVQNGIPNIPQIRAFTTTSSTTVPVGGTININVKSTIRP